MIKISLDFNEHYEFLFLRIYINLFFTFIIYNKYTNAFVYLYNNLLMKKLLSIYNFYLLLYSF